MGARPLRRVAARRWLVAYTLIAAVEHAVRLTLDAPDRYGTDRIVRFVEDLAAIITARAG